MTLYSLVLYLLWANWDWQLSKTTYQGATSIETTLMPASTKSECTMISANLLRQKLHSAKNVFSKGGIGITNGKQLCLPPGSTLEITPKELILRNQLVEIRFTVEPAPGISYMEHGEALPNGGVPDERRLIGIRVNVYYSRIRAQHLNMQKYQEWAKRVVDGAAEWFRVHDGRASA